MTSVSGSGASDVRARISSETGPPSPPSGASAGEPNPPDLDLGPAASRRVRERDTVLAADGWTRRFIGAPPRLAEMVDLYRSLGHEVHTEPLEDADLAHECAGCTLALALFRIVYTRSPR